MSELLRVEKITKTFRMDRREISVLKNIGFSVQTGEKLAIVGASGAGKSTLLHILGALDEPTSGSVYYKGGSIFQKTEQELALFRNKEIGFVFQFHHLLSDFSAVENVMIPAWIARMNKRQVRLMAEAKLAQVGLSHRFNHKPGELSGGEQQRVALARALILNPSLLLADEPTGNLDTHTSEEIQSLLNTLHSHEGMTMILVTHNEWLAKSMPRCLRMKDGMLMAD